MLLYWVDDEEFHNKKTQKLLKKISELESQV